MERVGTGNEMNCWCPIQTAPKDKVIDLWKSLEPASDGNPRGVRFTDCRWSPPFQNWWDTVLGRPVNLENGEITHWRYAPDPPDVY